MQGADCTRAPRCRKRGMGLSAGRGARRLHLRLECDFSHILRPMTQETAQRSETAMPPTYEAALQELEQLVGRLESGDLPLEELMGGYQRGAALLQFCRDKLALVENQIKVVEAGTLKSWDAAE
jgi:exodeoxyribonuclease VII small subunit